MTMESAFSKDLALEGGMLLGSIEIGVFPIIKPADCVNCSKIGMVQVIVLQLGCKSARTGLHNSQHIEKHWLLVISMIVMLRHFRG